MKESLVKEIKKRQVYMEDIRRPAEDIITELIDLLLPSSTPFVDTEKEGEETGTEIYTSDPVRYLRTCADGTMGCLVSPHFRWFAYQMANRRLRDNDEVRRWLQECEEQMYFRFKSPNSNFYGVQPPHFRYAIGIGNSVILKHEDVPKGTIVFTCPHPRESYWLEDSLGRTLPYHRKYKRTVSQALEMFKKEKLIKITAFKTALENGKYNEEFEFLQCIYVHDDPIFDDLPEGSDVKVNRPYMQFDIIADAPDNEQPEALKTGGYWSNPVSPWRLEKNDDEVYGRGIGHLALPDIRGANELEASMITGVHKEIEPPLVYPASLRGRVQTQPGGETALSAAEVEQWGQMRKELYSRSINYTAGQDFNERKLAGLREWFSVDYFLQLSNLAQEGSPPTATQILGMADEKAILLIGRIGRYNSDCYDNLMRGCFLTEYQAGRLPPPPQIVLDMGGNIPEVQYLGPLDQAQRRLHTVRNDVNAINAVSPAFEIAQETRHKIRWGKWVEQTLEKSGFAQELIVPDEEYEQIVAEERKAIAEREQAKLAIEAAKVAPGLAKKTDPTSILSEVAGRG